MFLSTVDVSLGRPTFIIVRLSARPFSGLVGNAAPPPVCFLPRLERSASSHYFFVLQVVSKLHGYFLSLDSNMCLIWTISWGLCSILESPFLFLCLRHFLRGFRSGQGLFGRFYLTGNFRVSCWGFTFPHSFRWSPILSEGCSFSPLFSVGFLRALACTKRFPVVLGPQNTRRDCSEPASDVLGSLLPDFLSYCSSTKKVSWDLFPALRRSYFCGRLASSFCLKERIK